MASSILPLGPGQVDVGRYSIKSDDQSVNQSKAGPTYILPVIIIIISCIVLSLTRHEIAYLATYQGIIAGRRVHGREV